ncbi:MAG: alanine racemase [Lachnospiraceae bacterium]|nr:alanine racemase [Lachnospiraceae bacterium]
METSRVYAGINLSAVLYNLESMHKNIDKDTQIVAVIKTDAYGHGALQIAKAIEDVPYLWGFAVATVDEAMSLIQDGRKKPILILGISFEQQFETMIEHEIRPCVCSLEMAEKLSALAVAKEKICHIHIKIDTGMSRIGFPVNEETAQIIEQISKLPNICIEGIFTHFAKADELDKTPTYVQIDKFLEICDMLEQKGISIPLKHCSNSAGIVEIPKANMNLVRAGIILYGLWPSEEVQKTNIDLKPVMSLKSRISFLKELEEGTSISYGGTYVTDSKQKIATVPVGYGDGYARNLSNKGYVLVRGQKAPICGRVCMDQFMIDVTGIEDVKVGDEVTLLGSDGEYVITMEELGRLSNRFNYEFACLITPRVPRIYMYYTWEEARPYFHSNGKIQNRNIGSPFVFLI